MPIDTDNYVAARFCCRRITVSRMKEMLESLDDENSSELAK